MKLIYSENDIVDLVRTEAGILATELGLVVKDLVTNFYSEKVVTVTFQKMTEVTTEKKEAVDE